MDGRGLSRDGRLIAGAVGVSAVGDFLVWVPLSLHLEAQGASGLTVAALFIALWAPVVVLAPVAGLVVDRRESRSVLIVASAAQVVVAAAMAFALDSTAAIIGLAALLGVGFAFAQPAEFALVPVAAQGDDLTRVNGWVETSRYTGMFVGPALGGVLSGVGGTDLALAINAGTFAVVVAAALALHARRPPRERSAEEPPDRARDGVVFLLRDRTLGLVVSVVFVSLLFMSATITAEVFFIKEDMGASDAVYGLLFACWFGGMVIGGLAVPRRIPVHLLAPMTLVFVGVQGLGVGLPTAWPVIAFGAAMWLIGGVGHGTKNVLARSLIQQRVPDHLHGRAFAAYNGIRNGAELVALAGGGALVAVIGARETVALAGAIPVLAVLVGLAIYRSRSSATAAANTSV